MTRESPVASTHTFCGANRETTGLDIHEETTLVKPIAGSMLMTYQNRQSVYLPTPEEIELMCEEIRSQWGESKREDRAGSVAEESELPVKHEDETQK